MEVLLGSFTFLMANSLRKLLRFEDKTFLVDLEKDDWEVDFVNPDGSRRPALVSEVNFFDLIKEGVTLEDNPS